MKVGHDGAVGHKVCKELHVTGRMENMDDGGWLEKHDETKEEERK